MSKRLHERTKTVQARQKLAYSFAHSFPPICKNVECTLEQRTYFFFHCCTRCSCPLCHVFYTIVIVVIVVIIIITEGTLEEVTFEDNIEVKITGKKGIAVSTGPNVQAIG